MRTGIRRDGACGETERRPCCSGRQGVPHVVKMIRWTRPGRPRPWFGSSLGAAVGILSATKESRVFEVTKAEGEVVWELRLPNFYGVYRADRIVPPLVHAVSP